MNTIKKTSETKKSIDQIMSLLEPGKILNVQAMQSVRGGEGNSSEVVIVPPPNNNG